MQLENVQVVRATLEETRKKQARTRGPRRLHPSGQLGQARCGDESVVYRAVLPIPAPETAVSTFQLRRNKARYLKGTFPHSPRLEPDLPL